MSMISKSIFFSLAKKKPKERGAMEMPCCKSSEVLAEEEDQSQCPGAM